MISHSKRNGLTILEHCKVLVSKGRVSYVKSNSKEELYYSIPYANTSVIMLSSGTSITDEAARMLADEGTLVGFSGGGGVPIFMGSLNEYRPTKYSQQWFEIWRDTTKRVQAAKLLQKIRVNFTNKSLIDTEVHSEIILAGEKFLENIANSDNQESILLAEGRYIKSVYKIMADKLGYQFVREHRGEDIINKNVTNSNYYCYGLAASTLWSLGIPYSLALLHGKTRRGGLVFDLADVIKCGIPLFTAMKSTSKGSVFKHEIKECIDKSKAFEVLFDSIKDVIDDAAL